MRAVICLYLYVYIGSIFLAKEYLDSLGRKTTCEKKFYKFAFLFFLEAQNYTINIQASVNYACVSGMCNSYYTTL